MSATRRLRRPLFVVLASVIVAVPVLGVPGVATAEPPPSTTHAVVGQLVQAWPEYKNHKEAAARGDAGPLSFVRTPSGNSVRVDAADVRDVPVGATVKLTLGGTITDDAATKDGYAKAHDVLATQVLSAAPTTTAPAVTPVNHPVSVVMVVPAGGTRDSTTLQSIVDMVNGPVASYWSEQTDGAVNFGVTAQKDWIDLSVGCQDPYALWDAAAQAVGFTRGSRQHLLVYVSSTPGNLTGCSDGLGEVGWDQNTGGYTYVRYPMSSMIAHELGHNLGLGHSSLMQCDGTLNSGDCAVTPYLDLYDVMGASWNQMGTLNLANGHPLETAQTESYGINWIPESAHDVTLSPVSGRSGVRGIELADGGSGTYWLEYRPASARDAWLSTSDNVYGLQSGVLLRLQGAGNDTSLLIDATPSPKSAWSSDYDDALPLNTPVRLAGWRASGIVDITVTGMTATQATIRIVPQSAVTLAYEASGGAGGPMGAVTTMTDQLCGVVGGAQYCHRAFANGEVIWAPDVPGGAHLVNGAIYPAWQAGGSYSAFGFPTTDTACGLAAGGCRQHFVNSNLYWSSATGPIAVSGDLRTAYESVGEESGIVGYPTAAAVCGAGGGCRQQFQGGLLVTSPATGTRLLPGGVAGAWAAQGYDAGPLGFPVTGLLCGMKDTGCGQLFQGGRIFQSASTGPHAVYGAIQDVWGAQGWEAGVLGYPSGDQVCGLYVGGCKQDFQGGTVYSTWSTGAHAVSGAVATVWTATGAESGTLGYPTTGLLCGLTASGCGQVFQRGRIYQSASTAPHAVSGPIQDAWGAQGWEAGKLGYPTGEQVCGLAGGMCKQDFQGGALYLGNGVANAVAGSVATAWRGVGGETGALGAPTSGLVCGLRGGGCGQDFQGGRVYVTPSNGTLVVAADVLAAWSAQGAENGVLGYPTSGLLCGMKDTGCGQLFQGGRIFRSASTGPHAVYGAIQDVWGAQGWEAGVLGYPSGDQVCGLYVGGCKQVFQGGTVYSTWSTGAHAVSGAVATAWTAAGAESGTLGYPTTGLICGMKDTGCGQVFQYGRIYQSSSTGPHAISGPIQEAWGAQGWEAGPLGYPTGDQVCGLYVGGCKQDFQGGTVYSTWSTGAHPVSGAVATAWTATGAESGTLGYPTTGLICGLKNSGCGQVFQHGRIYQSASSGAHAISGPIQDAWGAQGWEAGPLGYPTGDQVCGLYLGGCKQDFQGGTVYSTWSTGAHAVFGAIATAWTGVGGESGTLGYPTSDPHPVSGGTAQTFQGGTLTLDGSTGQVTRS